MEAQALALRDQQDADQQSGGLEHPCHQGVGTLVLDQACEGQLQEVEETAVECH